jgi:hypothetical protein
MTIAQTSKTAIIDFVGTRIMTEGRPLWYTVRLRRVRETEITMPSHTIMCRRLEFSMSEAHDVNLADRNVFNTLATCMLRQYLNLCNFY